jgi:hypothetical protein
MALAVFLSCVVEQTKELSWLREWGLRLDMLYSEADGRNPAVNAVYRVLAICMFGIGLYEIKVPLLSERVKVCCCPRVHMCFRCHACSVKFCDSPLVLGGAR